ncbi:MAG: hypothetical protein NWE89_13645 [Candidatus Bathyarchaeota archaeon]|nr:hypothetical protein [Candidatus Bathyarchaeota archaeon]
MGKLPTIVAINEQLRRHQLKEGYSVAQLVVQLNAFGSNWNATHVGDLLAGRVKPTTTESMFLKRYLLNKFYDYNNS